MTREVAKLIVIVQVHKVQNKDYLPDDSNFDSLPVKELLNKNERGL